METIEKAIYGLAMPFDDFYITPHEQSNVLRNDTFQVDTTNKESVTLDSLVGLTFDHDYLKEIARTGRNLQIKVTDKGVFFKAIPDNPFALSMYKKVKRGAIKYCSISYSIKEMEENNHSKENLEKVMSLCGVDDDVIVRDYKDILVYELCICNQPANELTFCTTDPNHPLLKGVRWDE